MSISNLDYSGLFKKVYGSKTDLLPSGFPFQKLLQSKKTGGESHQEAIQLSHENGVTLIGESGEISNFEDAAAGVVKQASIKCKEIFLSSALPTGAISSSTGGGDKAFYSATKDRVAANIAAHSRFREQLALYGQSNGLGRVSYLSGDFRDVTFADGGGTIGGVVITAGINASSKVIMLEPSDIASGIWQGAEGMAIEQIDASDNTVADGGDASGKVTAVDLRNGLITVDFTPVSATAEGSHYLALKNQNTEKDMHGAKKILTNNGTLFGINAATYGMWKGTNAEIDGKLTFSKLAEVLEQLCDFGLTKDVEVQISFESWKTILTEADALRQTDSSYDSKKITRGHESIAFHFVNGVARIQPNRFVRRGDAFIFAQDDWKMIETAGIGFKVPGADDGDLMIKPITNNSYVYRSYSAGQPLCLAPKRSAFLTGINPESAS